MSSDPVGGESWVKTEVKTDPVAAPFSGDTYIVFVLDRSSSMMIIRNPTVNAFNEWLQTQQDVDADRAFFTLVLFNTDFQIPIKNADIKQVNPLTQERYAPSGMTRLYDAIAHGIETASNAMKPEDRAVVVVLTDGEENSSREYRTAESIKTLIQSYEARGNFTFTYMSSAPNAWQDAAKIGTQSGNTAVFAATPDGVTQGIGRASASLSSFRGQSAHSSDSFYGDAVPGVDDAPKSPTVADFKKWSGRDLDEDKDNWKKP